MSEPIIMDYQPSDAGQASDFQMLFRPYFAELGVELTEEGFQKVFAITDKEAADGSPMLLAYVDKKPAGFAIGQIDAPGLHWCERPGWGCVCEFYAAPEYRKRGVGRALCSALLSRLREKSLGLPGFYLTSHEGAQPFWERCGFKRTGEICEKNEDELMEIRLPGGEDRFFQRGERFIQFESDGLLLRDMVEADVENYVRWNTVETEWKLWDGPWARMGPFDEPSYRKRQEIFYKKPLATPRESLEICVREGTEKWRHVGSVCSYLLDDEPGKLTIGIDVYEPSLRRRGVGTAAFTAYIHYLMKAAPEAELYTQTWSGNFRMIGLAEKCCFEECRRLVGIREVRGERYDALTFRLNIPAFRKKFPPTEK